jgi:stage II sporulation protein D
MGIRFLTDSARELIATTAGEVATFDDRIILAAFSANSGGHTCSSSDCWGTALHYLAAVPDVPEVRNLPGGMSTFSVTRVNFQKVLKANKIIVNVNSPAQSISVLKTNSSQRITQITAQVANKIFNLNAAQTTKILNSTFKGARLLEFGPLENDQFTITKLGFGHAIGMSQWGAYALARQGKTYDEILNFYYRDTKIDTLIE